MTSSDRMATATHCNGRAGRRAVVIVAALTASLSACSGGDSGSRSREKQAQQSRPQPQRVVLPEAVRTDTTDSVISKPASDSVLADTAGMGAASQRASLPADSMAERYVNITPASVARRPLRAVPSADAGPAAAHVQILLDRAHFSPGVIDGMWGKNAIKAVKWFQASQEMDSTGRVDSVTYAALLGAAGEASAVAKYTVMQKDVAGPFVAIPTDPYEQAKLSCMCYSSVSELLAEKFHTTPKLLGQMNPGVVLDSVVAGTELWVPNVAGPDQDAGATRRVARIVVSRSGFWTHALDSAGRIIRHFPSTLGASYDPSPTGDFSVTRVAPNPRFYYQPDLFADEKPGQPTAWLPAGPNSPVGVMWIALSKPHYGIHGTPNPEAIGYTSSHGCIRLTNWDAMSLSKQVSPGIPVQFQ